MAKKKKVDAEKKAALQLKKEAKADKAARKRLAKSKSRGDGDGDGGSANIDDQDVDSIIQAFRQQDLKDAASPVLETMDAFPPPRANGSFTINPKTGYFYLFGGEYYDGVENVVLDEILRWDPTKKNQQNDEEDDDDDDDENNTTKEINAAAEEPLKYSYVGEWKRVITPNPRPPPRCAHAAVYYNDALYVFGGEYATADQYHHYRDLWKFDVKTNRWEEIRAHGTPPAARSGHVMWVWRHYLLVFGGFYEALRETRWYDDVHVLDLSNKHYQWLSFPQQNSKLASRPEARSACNHVLFQDLAIIHGGYSKLKHPTNKSEAKVHTDVWKLHLKPILQGQAPTWERVSSKPKGGAALTTRSGTACCSYKNNRMLVFGGVQDEECPNHKVQSVFYNDLFAVDLDCGYRWFKLNLKSKESVEGGKQRRRRRKGGEEGEEGEDQQAQVEELNDDDSSSLSEEEGEPDATSSGWDLDKLRSNMFAFIDGDGNIVYEKIEEEEEKEEEKGEESSEEEEEETKEEREEKKQEEKTKEEEKTKGRDTSELLKTSTPVEENPSVQVPSGGHTSSSSVLRVNQETGTPEAVERTVPLPRIKAEMSVKGNTLYLYGGLLEVGDREVTLDDCWTLDLHKRNKWVCVYEGSMHMQVWRGVTDDDEDSYISTDYGGEDEEEDEEESEEEVEETKEEIDSADKLKKKRSKSKRTGIRQEMEELRAKLDLDDSNRTPQIGEVVADFYSRTSEYWNQQAAAAHVDVHEPPSQKELKRAGFNMARDRYEGLKPVLDRLNSLDAQQIEAEQERKKEKAEQRKKDKKKEKKEDRKERKEKKRR